MRILLIKMSSMGDVFHTFPALSDALQAIPDLQVDWIVEQSFAEIPKWHPAVDQVYPIALRQWRKNPFSKKTRLAVAQFFATVNQTQYDLIIDAQGLYKSLWVGRKVPGTLCGFDWQSAREPVVSLFYQRKYKVAKDQHAILRLRQLFAQVLGYSLVDKQPIVYGLNTQAWSLPDQFPQAWSDAKYMVFLHGTTWETKYWPEAYWIELLQQVNRTGFKVVLPWGNAEEFERAQRIASAVQSNHTPAGIKAWVPPKMLSLNTVAKILKNAQAVVTVDTGLSHVAAALDVPMVVLYRVTDPKLVGADGAKVIRLESPCAADYIKAFKDTEQERESLTGLAIDDVCASLEKCLRRVSEMYSICRQHLLMFWSVWHTP